MSFAHEDEFVSGNFLRGVLGYFPIVWFWCWLIQGRKRVGKYTSRATNSNQAMPNMLHKVLATAIRCHFGKTAELRNVLLFSIQFDTC